MTNPVEGVTYAEWLTDADSSDVFSRRAAEGVYVVLYDAQGRPQKVQGRNVVSMLAKRTEGGEPIFYPKTAPVTDGEGREMRREGSY